MLRIFKKGVLLSILVVFSGCVSTKNIPIDQTKAISTKPKTILITKRVKPDFAAMTALKASFGLIGSAAMISEGNDIIRNNAVENPANFISSELSVMLSKKYNLEKVESMEYVESQTTTDIAKLYSTADWIIDVETINWSFVYFPTDWNNYRVIYSAKLRLIDSRDKKMIAEGFCARVPEEDDTAPSYDELLEKKAERLKFEFQKSALYCIDEFKKNVLKI